jgi:hypothetical protein
MKRKSIAVGALVLLLAGATWIWAASARVSAEPLLASSGGALALVEKALAGPAGPDDEGQYNMIDPIGPGGATPLSADNEVFSKTVIGGVYTRWQPYHDPFTSGGGYNGGFP